MSLPIVLVTGYPKFSNFNENVSEKIIQFMRNRDYGPFELHTLLLPVSEEGSNLTAKKIINGQKFDAIIHLGLSNSRDNISLERFAYNEYKMTENDNSGRCITSGQIIQNDIEIYETTAPMNIINQKFLDQKYVSWSDDPGRFICNETYFTTLSTVSNRSMGNQPIPTIFIHLPNEKKINFMTQLEVVESIIDCMIAKPKLFVVGGLIFDKQGRVLSCKRPKGDQWSGWWEFPGGKIDLGENPYQALTRELSEELNVHVIPIQIEENVVFDYIDKQIDLTILNCGIISEDEITLVEHDGMKWLSREELLDVKWLPADLPILEKWFNEGLPSLPQDLM